MKCTAWFAGLEIAEEAAQSSGAGARGWFTRLSIFFLLGGGEGKGMCFVHKKEKKTETDMYFAKVNFSFIRLFAWSFLPLLDLLCEAEAPSGTGRSVKTVVGMLSAKNRQRGGEREREREREE